MIFSGSNAINGKEVSHIDLILNGLIPKVKRSLELIIKSQTRRLSGRYRVGYPYAIQPKRTARGLLDVKIHIDHKWRETRLCPGVILVSEEDAWAEGGYTPRVYEDLFEKMYPKWTNRWAYVFHPVIINKALLWEQFLLLKKRKFR